MDPTYRGFGAPVPTARRGGGGLAGRMTLVIVIAVIAIIGGAFMIISSQDSSKPLQPKLLARLDTLQKIVAEGTKNATDGDLRKINADISIQVMSDTASVAAKMKSLGQGDPSKADEAAEADAATFASLKDAALNSNFDSTYRRTIAQKLESTNALIRELYDKTASKDLKPTLNDTYTHFKLLENQLAGSASSN